MNNNSIDIKKSGVWLMFCFHNCFLAAPFGFVRDLKMASTEGVAFEQPQN